MLFNFFASFFAALLTTSLVVADTDPSDVEALVVLYSTLNKPPQLTGWKSGWGDPCGESWKGITCQGSSIIAIQVPGLGLNGTMGYVLESFASLKTLDLSNNQIHDSIPFQLPPDLISLNLASNNLTGSIPYSIVTMVSLNYLNLSLNLLSQSITDVFTSLQVLSALDLSFNSLSGDLPNSFSSLSNLSILNLQNNQLTGTIDVLADLPLRKLNVAYNNFSGSIPKQFSPASNFIYDGNSFDNVPASLPPPNTSAPPGRFNNNHNHTGLYANTNQGSYSQDSHSGHQKDKGLTPGRIVGVAVVSIIVAAFAMLVLFICVRKLSKHKHQNQTSASPLVTSPRHSAPSSVATLLTSQEDKVTSTEVLEQHVRNMPAVTDLKLPPADKWVRDRVQGENGSSKRLQAPITATSYTVASLQTATNSFSQECLVGEGSLGHVYKAEYPDGKILAVKKINSATISFQEQDSFLDVVSNMSRLRHPNIVPLVGYCAEHGQRLLVSEYIQGGTLHDALHFVGNSSNILTWNARVKVALGTARALEYLHEVCSPAVVHRNFKSVNILLDEELNPHLSDCGLSGPMPNNERQVSTQMVGSFGYSAPEYAMSGIYTAKSDVYSFGVVMLELLTGREPLDRIRSEQSLVRWATPQLHDIDALSKMVDPALNGMYPVKSLSRFADIIALCVQPEPEFRPPMSEIVEELVRLMQRASIVK